MGAIKSYELITKHDKNIHMSDMDAVNTVISEYIHGKVAFLSKDGTMYDLKQDKMVETMDGYWEFEMDCERARGLERELCDMPCVKRFLLVQKVRG